MQIKGLGFWQAGRFWLFPEAMLILKLLRRAGSFNNRSEVIQCRPCSCTFLSGSFLTQLIGKIRPEFG